MLTALLHAEPEVVFFFCDERSRFADVFEIVVNTADAAVDEGDVLPVRRKVNGKLIVTHAELQRGGGHRDERRDINDSR